MWVSGDLPSRRLAVRKLSASSSVRSETFFQQRVWEFEGLEPFSYEELKNYLAIQRKINESFQKDVEESYDYFEMRT